MSDAVFCWPISSFFGWGVRGLGYALNWPGTAVSAMQEFDGQLPPDDPRWPLLRERARQSINVQKEILSLGGAIQLPDAPVFVALPNDLRRGYTACGSILKGRPTIACPVFEDVAAVEKNVERLKEYDAVVVASRWNQDVLASFGVASILNHEGVDQTIFNPSVKQKRSDGRFRVFSGGKAEYRKGQDIVMEAFRLFAETHDDAALVAAWGSPWSQAALDFEGKWKHGSPPGIHIGMPNYPAWAQRAGIKPHQFEAITPRPNWQMTAVYGSCDVAVFPNRCEGGTNFVAMECMACGVPVILNDEFGQRDIALGRIRGRSVEQVVFGLEKTYENRGVSNEANLPAHWTWERHCNQMQDIAATYA